jgi:hypothetical protein
MAMRGGDDGVDAMRISTTFINMWPPAIPLAHVDTTVPSTVVPRQNSRFLLLNYSYSRP